MHADASAMGTMSREEFAEFYERTAPKLRAYLARVAANADLADDLAQEAFIRLIGAAPAGEAERRGYLYRTATNLAFDHLRAARRERIGLAFWKRWQPESVDAVEPSGEVERAFLRMTARERALLWLAYVEGATHAEIAQALGCGEKSVKVLLFRARRRMEGLL